MPDNANNPEAGQPAAGGVIKPGALGLGERLRSARKARAMSLEHVSEALHLDEAIILALEDERFDVLGAPVFVRGHLKAYARLVGLSPDAVLDAFNESEKLPDVVPTVSRDSHRSVTVNPVLGSFWALVILLGFGLGIYLWLGDSSDSPRTEPVTKSTAPEPDPITLPPVTVNPETGPSASLPVEIEVPLETPPRLDEVVQTVVRDQPEPQPQSGTDGPMNVIEKSEALTEVIPEPVPVPEDRPVRLSLRFTEESWVDISDTSRRLLFGLQRQGRRRELTGEPLLSLLLGNANGVEIRLNDRNYAIPDSSVNGKVARFEITRADLE